MKKLTSLLSAACLSLSAALSPVQSSEGTMLASWYGPGFHGNLTANGEIYDQYSISAAHKTLPFGTRLKVCYKDCVVVRINDRGPYIGQRELDLSYAAAKAIGMIEPGVVNVRVDYL